MTFGDLIDRVMAVAGVAPDAAYKVANELWTAAGSPDEMDEPPTVGNIVDAARRLDVDVDVAASERSQAAEGEQTDRAPLPELTMDPAEVLLEVYKKCPRVMAFETPRLGQMPDEFREHLPREAEEILDLDDEVKAMIGKIDVFENSLTFTVRDEANDIDREIGPIDLGRFKNTKALERGLSVFVDRLGKNLAADMN